MVKVSFACKYWISPSGNPPLQVVKAVGTVNVIVFPIIPKKTELSKTEPPKLVHADKSK